MQNSILKNLYNKKVVMLGLGVENFALLKYLMKKKVRREITICDQRIKKVLGEKFVELNKLGKKSGYIFHWKLGKDFNKLLYEFDILFRSPGWPIFCSGIAEAKKKNKNIIVSSPMKLFFDLCPTKNIIGVTGTKGKGTTSSLIYYILKKAGKKAWLGGNIGVAPFEFIDKIKKNNWIVLELSSFQLEDLHASPHIAVLTNFYSEHLAPADPNNPNYHKTLAHYFDAKINILNHQRKKDYSVINSKFKIQNSHVPEWGKLQSKIKNVKSKIIFFTKSGMHSQLPGEHNKENVAAAAEVAKIVGIKKNIIKKAVASFKGLEHRIEFAGRKNGIRYYDDSFATTPESSIIAMRSFDLPIILLGGGADKGSNFKEMAEEIKKRVKFLILFNGIGSDRLNKELKKIKYPEDNILFASSMKKAIAEANKKAFKNDIILLSPGCASFGVFRNYKERGNLFKAEIKK